MDDCKSIFNGMKQDFFFLKNTQERKRLQFSRGDLRDITMSSI